MFWEYDPRMARRWNLDPKPSVGISEYSVFNNSPIKFDDPLGDTIRAKGDSKSINEFLTKASATTGNTYALNKNGQIIRTNKDLNTKTTKNVSAIFSSLMETMITNSKTMDLNFTAASDPLNKGILFDSYFLSTLDMSDFKKIKSKPVLAALLSHALSEYFNAPETKFRTGLNYKPAHAIATVVESFIIFEMNGSKPGAYGTRQNPYSIDLKKGQFKFTFNYGPSSFRFKTTIDPKSGSYSGDIIGDVK